MGLQDRGGCRLKGDEISGVSQQLLVLIPLTESISPPSQAVCELPLIQAVLQPVQAHRGAGGAGEERPAEEARSQSHECHQHTGGEPRQLRQGGLGAESGGQGARAPTQGGARVL